MNNQQGQRAEEIFGVRITQDYIFRARDLGAKWPISDYYVEIDDDDDPLFFIVQIKSSRRGYDRNGALRITVPRTKLNQLGSYNAPTFVAGVDIDKEVVHLTPLYRRKRTGISAISQTFTLSVSDKDTSRKNLNKLLKEIRRFWAATNCRQIKRSFKSKLQ